LTELFENEKEFSEENRAIAVGKILRGLSYIHNKKIIHRDIKTDNVVVSREEKIDFKNLDLRLIDFGMSALNTNEDLNEIVGTPYYIAPEVIM
jgi:serine/threonine protein kinase